MCLLNMTKTRVHVCAILINCKHWELKKICRGYTWFRGELLHIDFVQLFFLLGIPTYKYVIGLCQCPHVSSLIVHLTASKCRYAKLR